SVAPESLAVVPKSGLVPKQGQPRVVALSQAFDIVPAARLRRQQFAAFEAMPHDGLGDRLAAQHVDERWILSVKQAERCFRRRFSLRKPAIMFLGVLHKRKREYLVAAVTPAVRVLVTVDAVADAAENREDQEAHGQ